MISQQLALNEAAVLGGPPYRILDIDLFADGGRLDSPFSNFYDSEGEQIKDLIINPRHKYTFLRLDDASTHPFYISELDRPGSTGTGIKYRGDGNAENGIKVHSFAYANMAFDFIYMNTKGKFTGNKKVRQALAHLINTDEIIDKVFAGVADNVRNKDQGFISWYTGEAPSKYFPYDVSKACSDLIAKSYSDDLFGLPIIITRFANIYGPGQLNFSAIIPSLIMTGMKNTT